MCGICGIQLKNSLENWQESFFSMQKALMHRGPDSSGHYLYDWGGIASRRLNVVDSAGSMQPLYNEDSSCVLVYNGMIYNFEELRERLIARGHFFKTKGDGEVILHLYEEKGEDAFNDLYGMFAIALFDLNNGKLVVARDYFGIKPLYYAQDNDKFVFSSEVRAIVDSGLLECEINRSALDLYFTFNYIPNEKTIYSGLSELLPGNLIVCKNGAIISKRSFWKWKKACVPTTGFRPSKFNKDKVCDELGHLLSESVKKHLIADQDVGAFLSGGLDSSSLVCFLAQNIGKNIKTFSVGYAEKYYDESVYANIVAKIMKTDHSSVVCSPDDVILFLENLTKHTDVPIGDQSSVSTLLVSKLASQSVKVCFSGEGADELFLGYPTYTADYLCNYLKMLPKSIIKLALAFQRRLPVTDRKLCFSYVVKRLLEGAGCGSARDSHAYWRTIFSLSEKESFFRRDFGEFLKTRDCSLLYYSAVDNEQDLLESFADADMTNWLVYNNLMRTDIYSMHHSLEVRLPFLYLPLVEYLRSIPFSIRFDLFNKKHLLKKIMTGKVDDRIVRRKKAGWHMPISGWLKKELFTYAYDVFSSDNILFDFCLDKKNVISLLLEHKSGKSNNAFKLWGLLVLLRYLKDKR